MPATIWSIVFVSDCKLEMSDGDVPVGEPVKERVILAIDIEARGQNMVHHGMLSLGWCLGKADTFEIIEKRRMSLMPLGKQCYEPDCFDGFWSKRLWLKDLLEKEAVSPDYAIAEFDNAVYKYETEYDLVAVVSDHPSFDIGMLNYYRNYFGYKSMHYRVSKKDKYRNIYCTDGYARGAAGMHYVSGEWWVDDDKIADFFGFKRTIEATHYPDEDAASIYEMHVKTLLAVAHE